jgi:sugar O-acyltransferase (sialic acid O-acetyltransferase NeuD family)
MKKTKKLIIFGIQDFAQLAYEYFTHDSEYEVVAFTVDAAYVSVSEKCGLPVVTFEELEQRFSPSNYEVYAAIVYSNLNRSRQGTCVRIKNKGYKLASYISSRSSVWHNVSIGEHCFIVDGCTIDPFVKIGNNVIVCSGCVIAHYTTIGDHSYLAPGVASAGNCKIGTHCFIGVNSSLADSTHIGNECWIGHGTALSGEIPAHSMVKPFSNERFELDEALLFRRLERLSMGRH